MCIQLSLLLNPTRRKSSKTRFHPRNSQITGVYKPARSVGYKNIKSYYLLSVNVVQICVSNVLLRFYSPTMRSYCDIIILAILHLIVFIVTALTLTNSGHAEAGSAVGWMNTSRHLATSFSRQTCSTTVDIGLICILDSIVASGNYKREAHILFITNDCTHLDKHGMYKHRYHNPVHCYISVHRHIFY